MINIIAYIQIVLEVILSLTSSTGKNEINCRDTICRCLNFNVIYGLHQSWCCLKFSPHDKYFVFFYLVDDVNDYQTNHHEGRIADTSGSWDDLATTTIDWFISKSSIQQLEFHISNG
jgi:hypothetical protein